MHDLSRLGRDADESALAEACAALVQQFCADNVDAAAIDHDHHIPAEVLSGLRERGLLGLTLPASHGGGGMSPWGAGSVVATLAETDSSLATTLGLHLGLGTRGLVAFGSPAQHDRWLPGLATHDIAAFATTEAGAGSDLAAIRTRGEAQGQHLRIDGEKIFVTNGALASRYTLTVATPGLGGARKGHSLVMIERGDQGLAVGSEEKKLGLRGSSTTSLYLDAVTLPMDRVIGEPGQGMAHLAHVLSWGRTLMAAGCVGMARAANAAAREHTSQRRQFGRTLDQFEVVQAQLAVARATEFAMTALVRHAAGDDESLPFRSLSAKVYNSESAWFLADQCVQLHGGGGFIEETGVARILRDARITRIFEGANDVLLVHLGLLQATGTTPRPALQQAQGPTDHADPATFASLYQRADALHDATVERGNELRKRFGIRVASRQRELHALGQRVVLRDTADAVVLRASHEGEPWAAATARYWLDLAEARALTLDHLPAVISLDREAGSNP